MRAPRFVTLCFVYCGLLFLAQYLLVYRYSVGVRGVVHLVVATGLLRLWKRDVEPRIRRPTDRQYTRSGRFRWFSP